MRVEDVMNHGAHTCRLEDSLHRAAQIMWDHDCGSVTVVNDDGRAVAVITDRDISMAAYLQGRRLSDIGVESAASRGIHTVRAHDTVAMAEAVMRRHKVRRLPVVDAADRPIGMFSLNDLARHAYKTTHRRNGLNAEMVASTLAAICEPGPPKEG